MIIGICSPLTTNFDGCRASFLSINNIYHCELILLDVAEVIVIVWQSGLMYQLEYCCLPGCYVRIIGHYIQRRAFSVRLRSQVSSRGLI